MAFRGFNEAWLLARESQLQDEGGNDNGNVNYVWEEVEGWTEFVGAGQTSTEGQTDDKVEDAGNGVLAEGTEGGNVAVNANHMWEDEEEWTEFVGAEQSSTKKGQTEDKVEDAGLGVVTEGTTTEAGSGVGNSAFISSQVDAVGSSVEALTASLSGVVLGDLSVDVSSFARDKGTSSGLSRPRVEETTGNSSRLQFFVWTDTKHGTLVIHADGSDRVESVYDQISWKTGLHGEEQRLIFGGRTLSPDQTLESIKVVNDVTIHLVSKLRSAVFPHKWELVLDLVRTVRRLIEAEDPQAHQVNLFQLQDKVRALVEEFLNMATQSLPVSEHMKVFNSGGATSTLVRLLLSTVKSNSECAEEAITRFVVASKTFDGLYDIHCHCASVLLGFCKILSKKAPNHSLYSLCRNAFVCLLQVGIAHTSPNFYDDNAQNIVEDFSIFVNETSLRLSANLDWIATAYRTEAATINFIPCTIDAEAFTEFVIPWCKAVEVSKGLSYFRPIDFDIRLRYPKNDRVLLSLGFVDVPHITNISSGATQDSGHVENTASFTGGTGFQIGTPSWLRLLFVELLEEVDNCLKVMDMEIYKCISGQSGVVYEDIKKPLRRAPFLVILKGLHVIADLYEGARDDFLRVLSRRSKILNILIQQSERAEDALWLLRYMQILDFDSKRRLLMAMLPQREDDGDDEKDDDDYDEDDQNEDDEEDDYDEDDENEDDEEDDYDEDDENEDDEEDDYDEDDENEDDDEEDDYDEDEDDENEDDEEDDEEDEYGEDDENEDDEEDDEEDDYDEDDQNEDDEEDDYDEDDENEDNEEDDYDEDDDNENEDDEEDDYDEDAESEDDEEDDYDEGNENEAYEEGDYDEDDDSESSDYEEDDYGEEDDDENEDDQEDCYDEGDENEDDEGDYNEDENDDDVYHCQRSSKSSGLLAHLKIRSDTPEKLTQEETEVLEQLHEVLSKICTRVFNRQDAMVLPDPKDRSRFFPSRPRSPPYLRFLGRVTALAVLLGLDKDVWFVSTFFKQLTGLPIRLQDTKRYDSNLYEFCIDLLAMDPRILDNLEDGMEVPFKLDVDSVFLNGVEKELCHNGSAMHVNSKNRKQYVDLMVHRRLTEFMVNDVTKFCQGFSDFLVDIPHQQFLRALDPKDLEKLIDGTDRYICVVHDWKEHTSGTRVTLEPCPKVY